MLTDDSCSGLMILIVQKDSFLKGLLGQLRLLGTTIQVDGNSTCRYTEIK